MSHRAFVAAWVQYGERWLTKDVDLVGREDAWFKLCKSRRYWDDESLPPEHPAAPRLQIAPPLPKPTYTRQAAAKAPAGTSTRGEHDGLVNRINGKVALCAPHCGVHIAVNWEGHEVKRLPTLDEIELGLQPEPLLWWEAEEWAKEEDWPLAV